MFLSIIIKKCASNMFEWCADGISPQMQTLQDIPFDKMPIWRKRHFKGKKFTFQIFKN